MHCGEDGVGKEQEWTDRLPTERRPGVEHRGGLENGGVGGRGVWGVGYWLSETDGHEVGARRLMLGARVRASPGEERGKHD